MDFWYRFHYIAHRDDVMLSGLITFWIIIYQHLYMVMVDQKKVKRCYQRIIWQKVDMLSRVFGDGDIGPVCWDILWSSDIRWIGRFAWKDLYDYVNPYPDYHSVIILDICSVHHASEWSEFIKETEILAMYLAECCPWLNLIEWIFNGMKMKEKDKNIKCDEINIWKEWNLNHVVKKFDWIKVNVGGVMIMSCHVIWMHQYQQSIFSIDVQIYFAFVHEIFVLHKYLVDIGMNILLYFWRKLVLISMRHCVIYDRPFEIYWRNFWRCIYIHINGNGNIRSMYSYIHKWFIGLLLQRLEANIICFKIEWSNENKILFGIFQMLGFEYY